MDNPALPRSAAARFPLRTLLLVPGGLVLLAGLDGALLLLGVAAPLSSQRWESVHGPLMVLGFVGTVIALERAVALRRGWGYTAPALLGVGGLALASPLPLPVGRTVLVAGTLALLAVYRALWARTGQLPLLVEILAAGCALGAATLGLAGVAVPYYAPWLVGFLVLTILGERLELSAVGRLVPAGAAVPADTAGPAGAAAPRDVTTAWLAIGWVVSCAVALALPGVGYPLLGALLLALVAVVAGGDVARHTIRTRGLTRYMAAAMLAGYGWLAVAGAVWLVAGGVWQGRGYDAVLHAVFLGFVMSMIMAHAPVILPAVIRRPLPYRPVLWAPLLLLHLSLVWRILAGDGWDHPLAVAVGGIGNIVAVLLFVVLAVASVAAGPVHRRPLVPPDSPPTAPPPVRSPALNQGTAP